MLITLESFWAFLHYSELPQTNFGFCDELLNKQRRNTEREKEGGRRWWAAGRRRDGEIAKGE